jgi:hypothetical protein
MRLVLVTSLLHPLLVVTVLPVAGVLEVALILMLRLVIPILLEVPTIMAIRKAEFNLKLVSLTDIRVCNVIGELRLPIPILLSVGNQMRQAQHQGLLAQIQAPFRHPTVGVNMNHLTEST